MGFQFTHPGKGATFPLPILLLPIVRFNSRTLGRVRLTNIYLRRPTTEVSIHAPWEGCDSVQRAFPQMAFVSIHAPWEGCDSFPPMREILSSSFNSRTLGRVRRETSEERTRARSVSIHAPWEGCDVQKNLADADAVRVSIHAPWEGCDCERSVCPSGGSWFQFTHPGKGATTLFELLKQFALFQFTHPGKGATASCWCYYG